MGDGSLPKAVILCIPDGSRRGGRLFDIWTDKSGRVELVDIGLCNVTFCILCDCVCGDELFGWGKPQHYENLIKS